MRAARLGFRLAVIALGGLAAATCQLSDVLRPPGVKDVVVAYRGDTILVQGRSEAVVAAATSGGATLSGAQFVFVSSDTSVLPVRGGDTLVALARGTATLTVSLAGSIFPDKPPSVRRTIRVVAGSVVVDSPSVTLRSLGDTLTLHATPLDSAGNDIPGAVAWRSSDTTVVTVAAGKLTALKNGTAAVRATIDFDTATALVTVRQTLAHFSFLPAAVLIDALGGSQAVSPTARDARGNAISGVTPVWSSGDTTVATVTAAGVVTGIRTGAAWVYARQGSVADSLQVTVTQRPTRVVITPNPVAPITALGNQRQLSAAAYDRRNGLIPSATIAWSVSDPTVLSVSAQGLVTGLAVGAVKVYAGAGAALDSVGVAVSNPPTRIQVTPRTATSTSTGDTLHFAAAAFNGRGDTVPGFSFAWKTPDAAVAYLVIDSGVVPLGAGVRSVLRGVGTARVIATIGALADTGIITASNLPATVQFKLPSGITVGPVQRTLTSLGAVDTPAVIIQNARNATLSRGSVNWSVDDPTKASVTALGIVTAKDTGTTLVRMTGNGLTDSALYLLTNTPASFLIEGRSTDTLTALGQILPFAVLVKNARGAVIPNYPVTWRSTVTTVADTVIRDTVTAKGFGTTKLIATAGTLMDTVTLVVKRLSRWTVDNSTVASPRVGSATRPYATIQDAVNAAGAYDTVVVKAGAGVYSQTVALSRSLTLLGDSSAFVANGRNPAYLPLLGHDSGSAGIIAHTSAPMTIRFLALRHSLDGPAIDDSGSAMTIDYFYVNPAGTVTSRVGRGISFAFTPSASRIRRTVVNLVRGYGVRWQSVSGTRIDSLSVQGVDSISPGVEAGAGVELVNCSNDTVSNSVLALTQGPKVLLSGSTAIIQINVALAPAARGTLGLAFGPSPAAEADRRRLLWRGAAR